MSLSNITQPLYIFPRSLIQHWIFSVPLMKTSSIQIPNVQTLGDCHPSIKVIVTCHMNVQNSKLRLVVMWVVRLAHITRE
eukprot:m.102372 g.102372  ORF g.102372 m.102372 type:complete len:80 (-) comp13219_c1_seq8:2172-2411(-)